MAGKLVELPRKLVWKPIECWIGQVAGTQLLARVEASADGNGYQWIAVNGKALVGTGVSVDLEQAKDLARKAMTEGAVVIRTLPMQGAPSHL